MIVVVLCGGKGTRIRGVDDKVPKPMIPIGGKPILLHIMEHYVHYGAREFILCTGYLGHVIRDFFGAPRGSHVASVTHGFGPGIRATVSIADTGAETMTGGRLGRVRDLVGGSDFHLTYGDGVSDVPIDQLIHFHSSHDKAMTLTAVRPPSRFGEVEVDESGIAISFNEKPQVSSGLISGGYFVCRSSVFDYVGNEDDVVLEAEPMRLMVKTRQLTAYRHAGFWQCMDTYRDWELLNLMYERNEAPWCH